MRKSDFIIGPIMLVGFAGAYMTLCRPSDRHASAQIQVPSRSPSHTLPHVAAGYLWIERGPYGPELYLEKTGERMAAIDDSTWGHWDAYDFGHGGASKGFLTEDQALNWIAKGYQEKP